MRKRRTIQQRYVTEALRDLAGHPTAQEIYREIGDRHGGIGIATVYGNLKNLAEDGEVRVLSLVGRVDRYEANLTDHDHIQCRHCGSICDISVAGTGEMDERVADASGYIVEGHEILFRGICPGCQERGIQTTQREGGLWDLNAST